MKIRDSVVNVFSVGSVSSYGSFLTTGDTNPAFSVAPKEVEGECSIRRSTRPWADGTTLL